ncbi:MAG: hypothetical protein WD898_03545 [Candidatus Paceibacterota bacterium]
MENSNGSQAGINWRQFGKHWVVVLILGAVAVLVIWTMLTQGAWIQNVQQRWTAWRAERMDTKPFRDDKFGGKTPEETFDLFIFALEKGDIELASKYFVLNKQESWEKTLSEYEGEGYLADFSEELRSKRSKWQRVSSDDQNVILFQYEFSVEEDTTADFNGQKINVPAGVYTDDTIFEKNIYTNIWKIQLL